MAITIMNDSGQAIDTKVIAGDGEALTGKLWIERLSYDIVANEPCRAVIHIGLAKTETRCGKVEWITRHPATAKHEKVARVVFADGSEAIFDDDGGVRTTGPSVPAPSVGNRNIPHFRTPTDAA